MIVINNSKLSHLMKTKQYLKLVSDHGYESNYKTYEK